MQVLASKKVYMFFYGAIGIIKVGMILFLKQSVEMYRELCSILRECNTRTSHRC